MLNELKGAARRLRQDRVLRSMISESRRLLSQRGEASSLAIAGELVAQLDAALAADPKEGLIDAFFDAQAGAFSPQPADVLAAAQAYAARPEADTLIRLTQAAEPPRQELFRRINRSPGGTAVLLRLRHALLERLAKKPAWKAVDADLRHLLSSWFNPGFLEMRRVDWNSPAQLLEQIIHHEAVHAVDGWDDLRRRLLPDRRMFAFFHPQLPQEPLIFVEVALVPEMADAIAPLIDKHAAALAPDQFKVAVFYSISNCQPGLRGVNLGNFLIKRVAEHLKAELPQLKTFCTLSPIPGFMAWLSHTAEDLAPERKPALAARVQAARATLHGAVGGDWTALTRTATHAALPAPAREALLCLAAFYLVHVSPQPGGDPVARFHLDNGARLERLNPGADLSVKGLRQSAGLMVNYLYDLARIDTCHDRFVHGTVVHARSIAALI